MTICANQICRRQLEDEHDQGRRPSSWPRPSPRVRPRRRRGRRRAAVRLSRCGRAGDRRLDACCSGRRMSTSKRTARSPARSPSRCSRTSACKFCLTGHSERRHVLKEPAELVAKKAAAIYAGGLILDPLRRREARRARREPDARRRAAAARRTECRRRCRIRTGW